jgi:hypothetical protein
LPESVVFLKKEVNQELLMLNGYR